MTINNDAVHAITDISNCMSIQELQQVKTEEGMTTYNSKESTS